MKTLAIVTPTFNRAHLLNVAFESLTKQTSKDFTWYVVDDGSTDNTNQVIEELKSKADFQVVYLKNTIMAEFNMYKFNHHFLLLCKITSNYLILHIKIEKSSPNYNPV